MVISFRSIAYPFQDFFRRVRNVYRWLPTLWNDRDWDSNYITEILIKKLEFTRDFYLSDKPYSSEAKNIAIEIQEAINQLHMTRDSWEFYEDPALEKLEQKWGKTTISFVPVPGRTDVNEMVTKVERAVTKEEMEQYNKEFRESLEEARKSYKKDKKQAYEFIAKKIDGWWD